MAGAQRLSSTALEGERKNQKEAEYSSDSDLNPSPGEAEEFQFRPRLHPGRACLREDRVGEGGRKERKSRQVDFRPGMCKVPV